MFSTPHIQLKHYIKAARLNRWMLNLFLIPGYIFGLIFTHHVSQILDPKIIIAIIAICCSAFANYTINEYLDAESDALHPEKKDRPGAQGLLHKKYIIIQYFLFTIVALLLSTLVNKNLFFMLIIFLLMGVIYNVKPMRTKDKPYLDILSESINNPLRFMCGWYVVPHIFFPPISILIACWMTGAFLMTMKRYAEFRHIKNQTTISLYRISFKYYTEKKLLSLAIGFALLACGALSIFLLFSMVTAIIVVTLLLIFFAWYLKISTLNNSPAQQPEQLFQQQPYIIYYLFLVATVTLFLFYDNLPKLGFYFQ